MDEAAPEGNARLTALTAVVLLVLLAAEGLTLLSLRSFLSWHIALGMLLVPVVGLKLATTGYRFARYYTRNEAYVHAGPPPPLLRLIGPILVAATAGLFGSGVALAALGPGTPLVLLLHQASFVIWIGAMTIHVLAHLARMAGLVGNEAASVGREPASRLRLAVVGGAVVAGAILAVGTLPLIPPWTHWFAGFHGDG